MSRWLRLFVLALPLLAMPLTACETKRIWIELPSFGDGNVDGVWLWRLAEDGAWERFCHLPIGDVVTASQGETVHYDQECGDRDLGFDMTATIERVEQDPETVRVGLWYVRWEDPGTYRLSSHGVDGESALSETTLEL